MPRPRISDEKRAAILADIEAGAKGRNQISRDHGVSVGTVSKIVAEAGHTMVFDRSKTKAATAAVEADNRARRAVESAAALVDAPQVRSRILQCTSGREAQGWATAYSILIDKHALLEKHDATDPGTMGSLLGSLLEGMQQKHGTGDA